MAPPTSIFSRKLDLVYAVWFGLHLAIMFAVDLVPLYPAALCPQSLLDLRQWYIVTYQDRFFTNPPAWFTAYAWMEAFYHVPLSLWAVGALIRGKTVLTTIEAAFEMCHRTVLSKSHCQAHVVIWKCSSLSFL